MLPKYICAALSGHAHVCAYTRIALNLMRNLNGAYSNHLRKNIYTNSTQKLTTCADRLLDKHVVISEHRKSCYLKTSENGFRKGNATIAGLQTHILLFSCLMIETLFGLFCSAHVALELRTV